MKLIICLAVCVAVYMHKTGIVYREYKYATDEDRETLQTIPTFLGYTLLYGAIAYQLINLSVMGVLPLL